MKSTLTLPGTPSNLMKEGDLIMITEPDTRWWKRLWCFVTRKGTPYIKTVKEVTKFIDDDTVELK